MVGGSHLPIQTVVCSIPLENVFVPRALVRDELSN